MASLFDRDILKCAKATACLQCESRGLKENMYQNDGVFVCKRCGSKIYVDKIENMKK